MNLVTPQTGPAGALGEARVDRMKGWISSANFILACWLIVASGLPCFHGQRRWEEWIIEEVAKDNPEAILRETIQPGVWDYNHIRRAKSLSGWDCREMSQRMPRRFFQALYRAFIDTDASLLEINPCVLTGDGKLVALDAKMTFDDNALFRHPNLRELRDIDEEDPLEVEASIVRIVTTSSWTAAWPAMVNGAGLAHGHLWTSLNTLAARRRIFWMLAAAHRRSKSKTHFGF